MRARGLKLNLDKFVGVKILSRPMRARGLKRPILQNAQDYRSVAPHAGAWIETVKEIANLDKIMVAPHAGAWIETCGYSLLYFAMCMSRPMRARGLKR